MTKYDEISYMMKSDEIVIRSNSHAAPLFKKHKVFGKKYGRIEWSFSPIYFLMIPIWNLQFKINIYMIRSLRVLLFLYKIYGEERSQNGTIEDGGIPYLLNHYWVWAMKIKIRHIWRRHAFSNQAIWVGALGTQSEN